MVLTRVLLFVLPRKVQTVRTLTAVMRSLVSARKAMLVCCSYGFVYPFELLKMCCAVSCAVW